MQAVPMRIFIILTIFTLLNPSSLLAATERRTALVIGNSNYSSSPLKNPVNDATDMAVALKRLGFEVILKKNVRHQEMEEAVEEFGKRLRKGGVGLFYYAGHGVQVSGVNYLIPIGAKINKESDVKHHTVSAEKVLDEMAEANNGLNIVLLDACRDNPYARSMRSSSRGLAIISSAPEGTFISYATGPGQTAKDGEGKNSPYTAALLRNISRPGLPIERVFKEVRSELSPFKQTPWELSSLKGEFYFRPGIAAEAPAPAVAPVVDEGAERRKLEDEKKQLAIATTPAPSAAKEIGRDGRFITYDNGTVLDTKSNLMWAAKDNGGDIGWEDAKSYCEKYRRGGYTDWRMPTQDELVGLYDSSTKIKHHPPSNICMGNYHLTGMIHLTCCCPWASETRSSEAAIFDFVTGNRYWHPQSIGLISRALPVRSVASVRKETERFFANGNGTVTDKKTGLMWADEDNGSDIGWEDANNYCKYFRAGGYTDWRMPTQDELNTLYDVDKSKPAVCFHPYSIHIATDLIHLSCTWYHASETKGSEKAYFHFQYGIKNFSDSKAITLERVLPVRSAK
ncbi:MAG: DUF1566 domain-containing protein [Syntrophales bacterium]|jgi:hypothetical protein|nr:DUF1566 domain-containing protein [Syntrophales bacterium]MCK9392097.1 DUF1566 domain-containing protein [Syntrophales bacterium]